MQQDAPKPKPKARGSNERSPSVSPPRKRLKGGDKGKGKGHGRGSSLEAKNHNKKPPARFDNQTLHREKGGKPICYPFNNKGCKRNNCTMLHICQQCLSESHGLLDCPAKWQTKAVAGSTKDGSGELSARKLGSRGSGADPPNTTAQNSKTRASSRSLPRREKKARGPSNGRWAQSCLVPADGASALLLSGPLAAVPGLDLRRLITASPLTPME